uniref:Uncharacterized protein n=1 Tax=Glossina austeni TaxID=7395 RepID=A0A1A9VWE2_GLOAU
MDIVWSIPAMFPKYIRTFTQAVEKCSVYSGTLPVEYALKTAPLQWNTSSADGLYPLFMENANYNYDMNHGPCHVATSFRDLLLFGIIYLFLGVFVVLCILCLGTLLLTA